VRDGESILFLLKQNPESLLYYARALVKLYGFIGMAQIRKLSLNIPLYLMKLHGEVYIFILFKGRRSERRRRFKLLTFSNGAMNIKFTVSIMPAAIRKKPELL